MLKLDLIETLAFAGVALFIGYAIRKYIPAFTRYNIPAPVIGGLLVAIVALIAHNQGATLIQFDTALRTPLMIGFFTSVGFAAGLSLLKQGGPLVIRFLILASVFALVQNVVGLGIASLFGLHPLFGVLVGSVTLTGGPATGLAFAPLFEQAGVTGAGSIAVAAAMAGIVMGGIVGGPVATFLVRRYDLKVPRARSSKVPVTAAPSSPLGELVEGTTDGMIVQQNEEDEPDGFDALKNIVAVLVAMWIGGWVSKGFAALGFTLPAYIGAMLVAAAMRNIDDATGWLKLSQRFIGELGAVVLALFLVVALMTLNLWELAGLAVPLLTILAVQVLLVAAVCLWPVFQVMGRDYEAAVMSGGFIGFMLGTTANAMAVMRTLVDRYGPAPVAFLVAPLVGAFFIDFTNALIITLFLNLFGG